MCRGYYQNQPLNLFEDMMLVFSENRPVRFKTVLTPATRFENALGTN